MIDAQEFLQKHSAASPRRVSQAADTQQERLNSSAVISSRQADDGFAEKEGDTDDEYDACLETALKSLEAAGTSKAGLRRRLERRGRFNPDVIERVITAVEQMGVVDDSLYAESVVRSCVRRQMGQYGALRELVRKGLDRGVAQQAVSQAQEAGQFDQSAQALAQTICERTRGLDFRKRLNRIYSAARRKGHDVSIVRQYADEILAEEDSELDAAEDNAEDRLE